MPESVLCRAAVPQEWLREEVRAQGQQGSRRTLSVGTAWQSLKSLAGLAPAGGDVRAGAAELAVQGLQTRQDPPGQGLARFP